MLNETASDTSAQPTSAPGFTAGLITGGFIGAVLALAFAPRAGRDFRRTVATAASDLGTAASDGSQNANASGDAVAQLATNARAVRGAAADHEIARFAASTKN